MSQRQTRFALITGYCFEHSVISRSWTNLSPRCGKGGIGEALAREYSQCNITPIATVLPTESNRHLSEAGIISLPLDITQEESILALKRSVIDLTGGHLDILVNNASV
jgi:1-acylglycerone phosphate reductase